MLEIIFWVCVGAVAYAYAGFPMLLLALSPFVKKRTPKDLQDEELPSVTLIISAYNEEAVIRDKIRNSLSIDYPRDRLEVMVVSDASSDRTEEIVREFEGEGVVLLRMEGRKGKTMGLNQAVPRAAGEIVVFSDANAFYRPDAIRKIVRNFADPQVGCVTGEQRYADSPNADVEFSENLYWRYELQVKSLESAIGSLVGGDGAIYGARKTLYTPLDAADINDLVNPLQIVSRGYRNVYEPEAICYEETAGDFQGEFRRKVRIVNRSWRGLFKNKGLLNPFRYGFFSIQLLSHKVMRWLVPVFGLVAVAVSIPLVPQSGLWRGVLAVELLFFTLAGTGFLQRNSTSPSKVFYLPYYFCLVNSAALLGIAKSLGRKNITTWDTVRGEGANGQASSYHHGLLLYGGFVAYVGMMIWLLVGATETGAKMTFLASAAGIAYIYGLYPLLVSVLSRRAHRPEKDESWLPKTALLIPAFNEEDVIEAKLQNSLELDYPKEHLEILLALDGCTDRTPELAQSFQTGRIRILNFPERRGKMTMLNEAISQTDADVLVFSDANTYYDSKALRRLVRNLSNGEVGVVSGNVKLYGDGVSFERPESLYYRYEHLVQQWESRWHSMVGVDGAMFAMRRELFEPQPADTVLDDFVLSMKAALRDTRIIYECEARGYERSALSVQDEFSRKVRIVAGGIQAFRRGAGVPPVRQFRLWWSYVSHKLLRWLVPSFLLSIFLSNALLLHDPAYRAAFVAQIAFYSLSLLGLTPLARSSLVLATVSYFGLVNTASAVGILKGMAGLQSQLWRKFDREESVKSAGVTDV